MLAGRASALSSVFLGLYLAIYDHSWRYVVIRFELRSGMRGCLCGFGPILHDFAQRALLWSRWTIKRIGHSETEDFPSTFN